MTNKRTQLLVDLGILDENKPELSRINASILNCFSNGELEEAVTYAVAHSSYAVKVADIVSYFHKKEEDRLRMQAERAYHLLCASRTTYDDVIVDDWLAGMTIRALYSSVQSFNERAVEQTNTDYALKTFVERYLNIAERADCDSEESIYSNYFFAGRHSTCCEFVGDYDKCQSLAHVIYDNKKVRLPLDPRLKRVAPQIEQEALLKKEDAELAIKKCFLALQGKKDD